VCNAAEGEPGTFKDRTLLRRNPYQLVEGVVIAAFAVGAVEAYIACKASFEREIDALTRAVGEMQEAGICHDCPSSSSVGPEGICSARRRRSSKSSKDAHRYRVCAGPTRLAVRVGAGLRLGSGRSPRQR